MNLKLISNLKHVLGKTEGLKIKNLSISPLKRLSKHNKRILFSFVILIYLVGGLILIVTLKTVKQSDAAWWPEIGNNWAQRKQLTLTNNSGATLNSTAVVAVSIDTKALVDSNKLRSDCSDLRILYQPTSSTATELTRHLVYTGGTTCSTSTTTKVNFNLQANITNGSSDTNYYLYYSNPHASTPTSTDNAFDISSADALLVCPFDGSTTCAAGETPSTSTGALRYSGTKSALTFNGVNSGVYTGNDTSFNTALGGASAFTIEAWIYVDSSGTTVDGIMSDAGVGSQLFVFGSSNGLFRIGGASKTIPSAGTFTAGWNHYATVYDGSTVKTYLNGTLKGTTSNVSGSVDTSANNGIYIGRAGNSPTYGRYIIDEVRISNVARYTTEFTSSTSPFIRDSNTKLLYHFDENGSDPRNASKAIDDSGNGLHATISSNAKYVSGLVGVDSSTSDTGYPTSQSYAGHNGIFIEEGTTNKITNPSFDNSTYDTNWDGVGGNLTVTENTSAPYYKFGSKSAKIVAAGAISGSSNMDTIGIDPDSTATHTLSAYIYNGTSGAVGGTVDGTVAKLVFEGVAQTTTYTDMGGGWWRLTYSAATTDSTNEYGIEVADTKTIYIDGVQLEAKAYATTYTDGTLGTGYAWTSTAHNSTSTRTAAGFRYSKTDNITSASGTISFWVQPTKSSIHNNDTNILSGLFTGGEGGIFYWKDMGKPGVSASGLGGSLSAGSWSAGNWYHVVFTWSTANNSAVLYNNLSSNSTTNSGLTLNGSAGIQFDTGGTGATTYYGNLIYSDLRIYNSQLSSDQVTDLYRTGLLSHSEGTVLDRFSNNKGEDPVGVWHFDDPSYTPSGGTAGQAVKDSTPNHNDGTLGSSVNTDSADPTWVTEDQCVSGKCLKFDGGDYVDMGDVLDPKTEDRTISGWFKTTTSGIRQTLYDKRTDTDIYGMAVFIETDNKLIGWYKSPNRDNVQASSNNTVNDGRWHHFSAVYNRSSNITLYLDGIPQSTTADISSGVNDNLDTSNNFRIGYKSPSTGTTLTYFNGFIDEPKIYPYARSAAQILTDYASRGSVQGVSASIGSPDQWKSLSNGLAGYWKMENGTGTSATDSSGNNNSLTLNGTTPAWTAGKFGNSVSMDSNCTSCSLDTATDVDILDFNATQNFTISTWFNPYQNYWGHQILSKKSSGSASSPGYRLYGNAASLAFGLSDGTNQIGPDCGFSLSVGAWSHITVTIDRVAKTANCYQNGAKTATIDISSVTGSLVNSTVFSAASSGPRLQIDETRVYNKALSPAEVSQLYNFAPGPVGYWKMDDKVQGNSKTIADSSGNGNNGTTSSTNGTGMDCSKTPGKYGGACDLDGTDDNISVGDTYDLRLTNGGTIEAWINPKAYSHILEKYWDTSGYKIQYTYATRSNQIVFTAGGEATYSNTAINLNKWNHVAVTFNSAGRKIYVNGVDQTDTGGANTALPSTTEPLNIGSRGTYNPSDYFNGLLDEVKIYNYIRTTKQMVQDMNAGHPAVGSPVGSAIGHWNFDEGYGDTVNNIGNQGNTLYGTRGGTTRPMWVNDGKKGKALYFDGLTSTVTVTNSNPIDLQGGLTNFTYSVWINPNNAGEGSTGNIYNKTNNHYLRVDTLSNGRLDIEGNIDRDTDSNLNISSAVSTGSWSHIIQTWDGTTQKIYINGVLKGSESASSGTVAADGNLTIGNNAAGSLTFNGTVDEFKIYNYALTEDEVKLDYNQGKSIVMGSLSDTSGLTGGSIASNSASAEYCVPGDTVTCSPPVGEWKFEEKQGTTSYDTSGNGNDGTYSNPSWPLDCKVGSCLGIKRLPNNTANTATITDPASGILDFNNTQDFTTETWIKISNPESSYTQALTKGGDSNSKAGYNIETSSGFPKCGYSDGNDSGNDNITGTINIIDGKWHHLACVMDRNGTATGTIGYHLFIDGKINASQTTLDEGSGINSYNLILGEDSNSYEYDGAVDETRIYNYARTPAQIIWDMNKGKPVAYWDFDDCQGTTLYERSGNSLHASLYLEGTNAGTCSSSGPWYTGRTGKFNYSFDFDGTNDTATVSANTLIDLDTSLANGHTFSSWIYADSDGESDQGQIYWKGDNTYLRVSGQSGSSLNIDVSIGLSTPATKSLTAPITTGTWNHIVVGWTNDSDDELTIYVNGKNMGSSTNGSGAPSSESNNLLIGGKSTNNFDGKIDDFRIYNYELTATQVRMLYNNGAVYFGPLSGSP